MTKHIVINVADKPNESSGPTAQLMKGLSHRRTANIFRKLYYINSDLEKVDATAMLQLDVKNQLFRSDHGVEELRRKCGAASKIYLATHGTPTDTHHCFLSASGGAALATYKQLANFMLALLPKTSKTHSIGLIMCYGARSARARSTDVDHDDKIAKSDLATSFAYRFFREMCIYRNVSLSARTGAVGMDGPSGKTTVETEVAVDAHLDKSNLIALSNPTVLIANFNLARQAIGSIDQGVTLGKIIEFLKFDPDAPILTPINEPLNFDAHLNALRAQYRYEQKRAVFQNVIQSGSANKYGKFLYQYKNSTLTITNVYGSSKLAPVTKLYEGSLL